jgi:hypothetical protein
MLTIDTHFDDLEYGFILSNSSCDSMAEINLWLAVIEMAIKDAFGAVNYVVEETVKDKLCRDARAFLLLSNSHFNNVCSMAGINPHWCREMIKRRYAGEFLKNIKYNNSII